MMYQNIARCEFIFPVGTATEKIVDKKIRTTLGDNLDGEVDEVDSTRPLVLFLYERKE